MTRYKALISYDGHEFAGFQRQPLGQVIHFDLPSARDEEKLRFALDTQTPEDIDVISVEEVTEDFHARYKPHSKTYEFLVDIGRPKNPMMRHYATHYPYPLEIPLMEQAIKALEGTHDFTDSLGYQCGK